MKHIKCECGHVNPEGTVLCESCGKPIEGNQHIDGNEDKKLLNMRYDGTARRSQTYNKSIIDKIWSFFSSVKVGVWLIVLALIASMIGTIFPQEMYIPADAESRDPAIFYEQRYGIFGLLFYQLGFHNLYSSWWYMLLIALIGISLVICSIDRFVPLYKALKNQKTKRHRTFLSRQRYFSETMEVPEEDVETLKANLKKNRYKIRDEDNHILAEKGRFSRWGPYVNHIGLIIILLAAILRSTPIMYTDEYMWLREGEQTVIPGTNGEYYIENHDFMVEEHDSADQRFQAAIQQEGAVPSNFQTDITIYKAEETEVPGQKPELNAILDESIQMNQPAKFDGYTLYQSGYQVNEFTSLTLNVHSTEDESETFGEFTIDLSNPQSSYELDSGFTVSIEQYYPDYFMNDEGVPDSATDNPKNPAFVLQIQPPDGAEPEISFIGIGKNIDTGENEYKTGLRDFEMHDVSGLTLRVDRTLPYFAAGAAIFMIGVIQGMYWQHRRIWINRTKNGVLLAAHTNKNWFGLKQDIDKSIEGTKIKTVEDQQEIDEEG